MVKLLCAVLLMGLFFPANAKCTEALQILVEDANEPWSNADGSGYVNDVIREVFQAEDIQIELKVVPYARCKALVMAGQVVACASMSWSQDLNGVVKFPDAPFYTTKFSYFQRKSHPVTARNQMELGSGVIIGIVNGYEYPEILYKVRQQGAILESGRSDEINLNKLAQGRLNLALVTGNDIEQYDSKLLQLGIENIVDYAFSAGTLSTYIGFSVKHNKGLWALEKYSRGFIKISNNGTIKRLKEKWFGKIIVKRK